MQEQTQEQSPEQTTALNTEAQPEREMTASDAVKIAKQMMKGENMLLEMELWRSLNELTAHGLDEGKKLQIKKSLVRAIQFGTNFVAGGLDGVQLKNFGPLAKRENNIARAIVKLSEYGTLVMADNLANEEAAQEAAAINPEQAPETNTENN